ncbi:MAG: hypothetical protein AVDCRST_MAG89-1641, partial [uncultured Gemmatimonadetes bacterium]
VHAARGRADGKRLADGPWRGALLRAGLAEDAAPHRAHAAAPGRLRN